MQEPIKILLVEDDAALVRMYERKLTKDGFDVRTALNGEDGLEALDKRIPDIILLDIMMPKMSGIDVLKKLKADPVKKAIPVVILTNLGDRDDDIKRCKEMGAADYWVKVNIRTEELVDRIKAILSEKKR
jgi:DNA-binding response OmpR family regulator